MNCLNLSWVSSIAWMVSENTMQDAGVVGELRVLRRTDRLVERGGAGKVGYRQVDEDHFGHEWLLFGGFVPRTNGPEWSRHGVLDFFAARKLAKPSLRGASRRSNPCFRYARDMDCFASLAMTGRELTPYVAIGVGMVRNARVTCQNNCRLVASATEWAVPGRMMNWRSPFGSRL